MVLLKLDRTRPCKAADIAWGASPCPGRRWPCVAVVDEVGIDGGMIRRGVIEFKQLVRPVITPMAMPGGQLVICNGKELLVYKKVSNKSSYSGKTWVKV